MKSIFTNLLRIFEYRQLLFALIQLKLTMRYKNSFLGFFWSLLNPISFLLIFIFLKRNVFNFDIPNFPIFVLIGLWIWNFVHSTIIASCTSIFEYQDIVKKIPFPKMILPLATTGACMVDLILALPCIFLWMHIIHLPFLRGLLLIPVALLTLFCFTAGLACIVSIAALKFRDLQHLLEIVFRMLFFMTPIFYSESQLPNQFTWVARINPIYLFIDCFRTLIYMNSWPSLRMVSLITCMGLVTLFAGLIIFSKNESRIYYHL